MTADLPEDHEDDDPAVAVTGMACRFPGADSPAEFWELLRDGADPHEDVPHEELRRAGLLDRALRDPSYVAARKRFADVSLFDAEYFGMTPAEAAVTDPQQRFLLETAVHALEDAGLGRAGPAQRIGVYIGLNHSDYLLRNVLGHPETVETLGWHRVLMGNDRGHTATSLSYRLGLTGPSVAVDCACSSSLAAVHQACRALLDYETDAALAGGAGIKPADLGYPYVEGGIGSPDGRCRPFSADARGTVFASGVGLVVLRRLTDARAGGDRILAVIRASDMNNDGDRKSGYTAPSPTGQAELIASVHQLAGITADQVSYVEAHGTATALGDPIEVSALTEAFRETTDATGFCAIGSVKSNIGHLDSASGIAGLIKVILALRHRTLPPTLGCERTNPHIDFTSSPFRVNTTLRPWTAPGPLLAGVSSFGVGGTNVHVLVEEAPPPSALPPGDPAESEPALTPLPFTARTPAGLDAFEALLRARLATLDPRDVPDAAATLLTRRRAHPLRRALLWRPDREPVTLAGTAAGPDTADRPVAFTLHHRELDPTAYRSLLDRQPAFRRAAERLTDAFGARHPAVVVALGCAAVWAEHGVRPGAVVADRESRAAAAVLTGVLDEQEVAKVLAALAEGRPVEEALHGVRARPARVPWYDADGAELCAPGRRPDLAAVFGGAPAAPGTRTLPPRVAAVVALAPAPVSARDRVVPRVFEGARLVAAAEDTRPGDEALRAALAQAWVTGLRIDEACVTPPGPGRLVDLPPYPFDRRRHWLDPARDRDEAPAPAEAHRARSGPDAGEAGVEEAGVGETGVGETGVEEADVEETARRIFAQALGVPGVAPQDDLFALGGDSLLATRIVSLARARWAQAVPLGSFLRDPSPGNLARLVRAATPEPPTTPEPLTRPESLTAPCGSRGRVLPVTPLQERFLFLSEIEGAAEAYNVPVLADLSGPLDVEALRAALTDVVARHESLRAAFRMSEDGPVQVIASDVALDVPLIDVPDEDSLRREIAVLLDRRIPLDHAPVLAARIFRTAPDRHVLALAVHHIGADARSTGILLRDLYACYERRTGGAPRPLPPVDGLLAAHVRAEAEWLRSPEADRQLRFWRGQLADPPERLELPGDRPRGAGRDYTGGKLDFTVPADLTRRVRRLAEAERTTPFAVVLSAFLLLLGKVGDRSDLVVGMPVSGRHRPGTEDLVANLVNTLPLRARIDTDGDFRDLLRATAARVTEALDHQDLPVEVLARELTPAGRLDTAPLFQVLFNMLSLDASVPPGPPGLHTRPLPFDRATSPYELSLDWWPDRDGAIAGRFVYDSLRFEPATIAGWRDAFTHLLDTVTRAPDAALSSVPAEPEAAAENTRRALTGPVVAVPERAVHAVFARRAAREPERLAVTDGRLSLTYGRLADLSAGLADLLGSHGVGHGDTVGIAMERGVLVVVAVLGVLRAGATPVPFDLTHPRRRLTAMAQDCGAAIVLCARKEDADFAPGAQAVEIDLATLRVGDMAAAGDAVDLATAAYLTYTSGTTGVPKGIEFPHRALANLIHWETAGYATGRRWLQLASFGFDASFHETFAALCSGGSLHIADEDTKHDHDALAAFVAEQRVEKAILPVSLLHALAARFEHDPSAFGSLKEIASTGEQLRLSAALVSFLTALGDCRLVNNYGPAETHVVTSYRFDGPPDGWPQHAPIGAPIQNVTLRILGRDGRDLPRGSQGELVIGGTCVATGYLGKPDLTGEKFPEGDDGGRVYRSGDRARLLRSGDIEFLGRGDQQVKIRGFRVELGEVEIVLREDPRIRDVALIVGGPEGDRRIDAYLVAAPGTARLVERTRARLRERLPAAMVPSSFTLVDRLPVNVNGKVDPARLPAPGSGVGERADDPAGDEVLDGVLALFRRVLDRPDLGPDEDFFDAGGHSLLATRLIHAVRDRFGVRLTVPEFYRRGTARAVTAVVAARGGGAGTGAAEEELPPALTAPIPLPPGLRRPAGPPSAATQKTFVFDAGQRLDTTRLRAAVGAVLDRHPVLRLRVGADGLAAVAEPDPAAAAVRPLVCPDEVSAQDAPAWVHDQAQAVAIDPRRDPLLRVAVAEAPGRHTLLSITVHLLALDGLGLVRLCQAIADAYRDPGARRQPDDGFLRYLAWRDALTGSERAAEATAVWRRLLPPPGGTGATPRPPTPDRRVRRQTWRPGPALHQVLGARCAEHRVTPFVLHLTAVATALSWAQGSERVCPAVPLDGRPGPSLDTSIGGFANVVPMPLSVRATQPLIRTLDAVREVFDQVHTVRTLPYADLATADPGLTAFDDLPVVFSYARDDEETIHLGEHPLRAVGPDPLTPGQRLHFTVVDSSAGFRAQVKYAQDTAEPGDSRLLGLYRHALYALAFEPDATPAALGGMAQTPAVDPDSVMERI
ncbi:non-ribosomal peptide synthetase [Streptomyces sparsogenes]|uniref:Amino acid adenylation n=1 Tax=Streptomyces sparsogenes DSM 40356 TaxID=1331668 RepID=A0A1R1SA21_9ACTN|nr:non-ribosomal peptide synthetase [Streptomyces sparsogenes]OMI35155.1 amino acid adenylation [Streptomyces sparsogenes DSM 40356]